MAPLTARSARGWSASIIEITIPPLAKTGGGTGYGSEIAVRTDPQQLFWTRVYGLSPTPLSRYDMESEELVTVTGRAGVHGDLRDSVLDEDGRNAWFLLTGGFARVDLEQVRVIAELRTGVPRYLSRLFHLGGDLLAATGWTGGTVTILDGHEMRVVKTVRMPSPDAVVRDDASGAVELLSFNGRVGRQFDLVSLSLGARRQLPRGGWPAASGDRVWMLEGIPKVVAHAPAVRDIEATHIAEVDIRTAKIIRRGEPLSDLRRVIGTDADGNVLVQQMQGMTLLDHETLMPVVEIATSWGQFGSVAILPDGRSAAVKPNWLDPERLAIVRWEQVDRTAGARVG